MVKRTRVIVASFIALCCVAGMASGATVGQPTPPCSCADGYSYANPITWGHYGTRWRRWPTECYAEAGAGATTPAQLVPGIPPYETPPAEEEERRAPAPTPRAESEIEKQEKLQRTVPTTMPPLPNNETAPEGQPAPQSLPFTTPPAATPRMPSLNPTPSPPTRPLGGGQPTSEADPPPALPFGAPAVAAAAERRAVAQPAPQPISRHAKAASADGQDDPPPAMPVKLANWEN